MRLGPGDDDCAVTAAQLREVFARLAAAGQWADGDPQVIIVMDAGYNVARLGRLLADLPVVLVGAGARRPGVLPPGPDAGATGAWPGAGPRHGAPVQVR